MNNWPSVGPGRQMFEGSSILVTGGAGSFGKTLVSGFLETSANRIFVFSRDEAKHHEMKQVFRDDRVDYVVGDVRDFDSISSALRSVDYVFHAAALKQVPSCELFPLEAVRTNILGSQNVIDASIRAGVKGVVCLSTDKAVEPVNAMGMSKALMEKLVQSYVARSSETRVCCTRYGNVVSSIGSVVPLFLRQIREKRPLSITNPAMTRFLMTLDEAVELVLFATENGNSGDIFVKKSPATSVDAVAKACKEIAGVDPSYPEELVGLRAGEKMHETLLSEEECLRSVDVGNYFKVGRDASKKFEASRAYTSENTVQLDVGEVVSLINRAHKFV